MGRVTYNGHSMNEFVPQRTAAYISQHDTHIGEMTVRKPWHSLQDARQSCQQEKAANIKPDPDLDVFMKAAATEDICADTMVGDEMIRGISGGQRKRVTTGEMLVGPSKALFMDEISTGLDSSTTYQIVNSLKQTIHILNGTAVISLLQPAPETYNLFDDIILLSDSQIVYQGPREDVLEFLNPWASNVLQGKVTSRKDQAQYWARKEEPYSFVTVKEFAEAFQSFHIGRKVADELASPFDRAKSHPAALTTKKYGVRKKVLLDANMSREYLLMKRNSFVYIFKLTQVNDGSIYSGALFFTVVMIIDLLFYPAWAYALPSWVLKIPITFVEVGVWVFITYYVIGFDPNVERLFRQYLLLLLVNQMASGLFRFIAAAGRNMIVANTFGAFALLMLLASGGFILTFLCITRNNEFCFLFIWSMLQIMSRNGGFGVTGLPSDVCTECNSECYRFNRIPWSYSIEVSWVLHRRTLVLDRSWGTAWIHISFEKHQAVITEESDNAKTATTERGEEMVEAIAEAKHNKKKGMVLPFQPHSITFDDIRYSVDMPEEMRSQGALEDRLELLKGVSGAFRPGVLTALMGVSGAGKTTLMDVLAGRKTAWLRLPSDVNSETRKMFIEEVMELVELTPLRDALVGLPGVNGLSTEQRKRLTIAVELVANPSIIFMDEPTSGLDARAAAIVMRTVRNTVDTGRTVVCTIHQPSIDIFEAFDELLLMKRGGQEIYVGPLGRHSSHLINYFEGIEGVSKIKDGYNPATWMLEVTTSAQEVILRVDFTEIYKNSDLYR
ncbi:hypothetical protein AAG906_014726 [Vitis piasezkii]